MGDFDNLFSVGPSTPPKIEEPSQELQQDIVRESASAKQLTGDTYMQGTKGFLTGKTGDPLRDALIDKQKNLMEHDYNKLRSEYSDLALREKLNRSKVSLNRSRIMRQIDRRNELLIEEYKAQQEAARSRAIGSVISGVATVGGAIIGGVVGGPAGAAVGASAGGAIGGMISKNQEKPSSSSFRAPQRTRQAETGYDVMEYTGPDNTMTEDYKV